MRTPPLRLALLTTTLTGVLAASLLGSPAESGASDGAVSLPASAKTATMHRNSETSATATGSTAASSAGAPPAVTAHVVTPPATTRGVSYGIAFGDTLFWASDKVLRRSIGDIVNTGAGWARVDLSWADVQPDSSTRYNWTGFDRIVQEADRRHVHVLATLAYTPAWARPAGCHVEACAPADPAAFAAFVSTAVQRYASSVHTWEIWNEENTAGFWAPAPNASAYTTLLKGSVSAIRSIQPDAVIISGGLAATGNTGSAIDTRSFLEQMCAGGANRIVDAIGYHPYTYPFLASYQASWGTAWNKMALTDVSFRSVLRDAGTPDMPVWATEFGAPTGGPGTASDGTPPIRSTTDHVTRARQSQIATDAVNTAAQTSDLGGLFWYTDQDGNGPDNSYYYGLRNQRGVRKPAFYAWKSALAALQN